MISGMKRKKQGDDVKAEKEMSGKARLEIRLDASVVAELQKLANDAGLSVNQVMSGLTRWAVQHGHPGVPRAIGDMIVSDDVKGCMWFGRQEREGDVDEDGNHTEIYPEVWIALDYSEERALRTDLQKRVTTRSKKKGM